MSRKLRFFKDQIAKAGLVIPGLPGVQPHLDLEELEVYFLMPLVIFMNDL